MAYEIRERDIGGILDESIYFFRDHARFLVPVALVVLFPVGAALELAVETWLPEPEVLESAASDEEVGIVFFSWMASYTLFGFAAGLVELTAWCFVAGVLIHGIGHRYLGYAIPVRASLRAGGRIFPRLLTAGVLRQIASSLGMLACILPGLAVLVLYYLFAVVMVLEKAGIFASFSRSTRLIMGSLGQSLALLVLLLLIRLGLNAVPALFSEELTARLVYQALSAVFVAFEIVASVMLYFSARCRLENLDLDLLANAVDVPPATPEAAL